MEMKIENQFKRHGKEKKNVESSIRLGEQRKESSL